MTREQQLELIVAQETATQNQLRGEIAELRATHDALRAENEALRASAVIAATKAAESKPTKTK